MSKHPIPRGTARAIRCGNAAPSVSYEPLDMREELTRNEPFDEWHEQTLEREDNQRYRDLREEGYTHYQAMLMSGLGDPDSL